MVLVFKASKTFIIFSINKLEFQSRLDLQKLFQIYSKINFYILLSKLLQLEIIKVGLSINYSIVSLKEFMNLNKSIQDLSIICDNLSKF
jgi:hypothetical protein